MAWSTLPLTTFDTTRLLDHPRRVTGLWSLDHMIFLIQGVEVCIVDKKITRHE